MLTLVSALIALAPATAPPTPVIPPSPGYITNGDGSRMMCTPDYSYCWPDPTGPVR